MHHIYVHEDTGTFHLQNQDISYIMTVLPDGHLGQLYCGRHLNDRPSFSHLVRNNCLPFSIALAESIDDVPLEGIRQEYPVYGNSDYRQGAAEVLQENGSRLADFIYEGYSVTAGKRVLEGLPATYTESEEEASTLTITLKDPVTQLKLELDYTIFSFAGVIARSARFINEGQQTLYLNRAMSLCLDLPDRDYEWISLDGAWARERFVHTSPLAIGIQGVESIRGNSSHQHNPFLALKRRETTEHSGEVLGFSLIYSGNFLAQAQVDNYDMTRVLMGINPTWFSWQLKAGSSFQTPEAVMVFSDRGLNGMSQVFHTLYRTRLARGVWRDRPRPILINNWEATYFDFNEEKILQIAKKARDCGIELFVLDDGWFGKRRNDSAGLGDWVPATELLPEGIKGLSQKVTSLGLMFGLWIEPEMVNPDSDLFRAHPDWILTIPQRRASLQRHQCVLDFSRPEIVDHIYGMISKILEESDISYVKWDMNRSITECYSASLPPERQGEVFHRYILGVYSLYEKLLAAFPHILFESCAGGGARFDPGMLYYAPQAWTSDDTDACERLKIQYGTSMVYPVSSMGSHVSAVPNHQTGRSASLKARADTAYFGTFGYELDLNLLSEQEQEEVRGYTAFMKKHRQLIQSGTFYRLLSPFEGNDTAWMIVSTDRKEAIVARYHTLHQVNTADHALKLKGLDPDLLYEAEGLGTFFGDELMQAGLIPGSAVSSDTAAMFHPAGDYWSEICLLKALPEETC